MGAIFSLGDPARHFWLTRSVARSMGISLSEAMGTGRLSPERYARMVTECRKCAFVTECEHWLAHNGASATEAPEDCANAALLNSLRN
ncbi:DUF6455 family protein [Thalassovita sp.]|jgi:hypothetical protein|uniref:DUF6455 family protein n=1 Tax=Thalassovita sp. TaxID=1979401 RepID=UPI0029DE89A5|nr:DUF6455 family protein [Thalassovita sp.]